MAAKLSLKNLPVWAKGIIAVLPGVIIALLVVFLLIMPKQEEIKALNEKIDKQLNQIAEAETKAARLEVLKQENEILKARLEELKQQLPEEKEISDLLKQVSDNGIASGLEIRSWKPGQRSQHESGIVYEIPVSVSVSGTYHNFGYFLGSLTRLERIVNIKNMSLASPKKDKDSVNLNVQFTAATFTAIPEEELPDKGTSQ
jgi:type IV pilus assembly protein PilO